MCLYFTIRFVIKWNLNSHSGWFCSRKLCAGWHSHNTYNHHYRSWSHSKITPAAKQERVRIKTVHNHTKYIYTVFSTALYYCSTWDKMSCLFTIFAVVQLFMMELTWQIVLPMACTNHTQHLITVTCISPLMNQNMKKSKHDNNYNIIPRCQYFTLTVVVKVADKFNPFPPFITSV